MTIRNTRGTTTIDIDEIHDNTKHELIYISTDKLKVILLEHLDRVQASNSWHLPFSILLTVVAVFVSADFKKALGISADSWAALFLLIGLISFVWLVRSLLKHRSRQTIDNVISVIKNKVDSNDKPYF